MRKAPTVVSVRVSEPPERVIMVAEMDALAIHAAWKVDAFHEHVARVHALPLTRV